MGVWGSLEGHSNGAPSSLGYIQDGDIETHMLSPGFLIVPSPHGQRELMAPYFCGVRRGCVSKKPVLFFKERGVMEEREEGNLWNG